MLKTGSSIFLKNAIYSKFRLFIKSIAENSVLIYATRSYKDQMLNFRPYLVPF